MMSFGNPILLFRSVHGGYVWSLQLSPRMQVLTQVNQYEQLGPDFETLTGRYHKLLEELRHAEYTLQEFQQAAQGSDSSP